MADALFVEVCIKVVIDVVVISREVEQELLRLRQAILSVLADRVDFAAVARREHDDLVEPRIVVEIRETLPDGRFRDGKLLTHLDGCRLMIESQTDELHF